MRDAFASWVVSAGVFGDFVVGQSTRLPCRFRLLESYVRALRGAQRYIYLENQFLWAPEIVGLLAAKLRRPPGDDFRLVIVLPAKANNGQDDTKGQLAVLTAADDGAGRLLAATLRSRTGGRDDPLYVHAKVGIIDDRWLTVGSANLNAHSLLNDTEMNVVTDNGELARSTRLRLWAEHLETEVAAIAEDPPHTVIDERFKPIAGEQLDRRAAGLPHPSAAGAARRLAALPAPARTAAGAARRRLSGLGAAAPADRLADTRQRRSSFHTDASSSRASMLAGRLAANPGSPISTTSPRPRR